MQTPPGNHARQRLAGTFTSTLMAALLVMAAIPSYATESISSTSLDGDYAGFISAAGDRNKLPVYIAGILSFYGDGTGSADSIWNLPGGRFADRLVAPGSWKFRYQVDGNGIVLMQAEEVADVYFVATRVRSRRGNTPLVLEIRGMSGRLETSGGNIVVGVAKRLPRRARFDLGSLDGVYGGLGVGEGGRQVTSVGYATLNGDGTGHEQSLWNLPHPVNVFQRELALLPTSISYSIDTNGIGAARAVLPDGTEIDSKFVITEARRVQGKYLAQELFVIQDDRDPITGSIMAGLLSRLYRR